MNIGIIGCRGIPNRYGGYEQVAGYLASGLVERGNKVTVYNPHDHPYQEKRWRGVDIEHCYDPEHWMGTAGQFIYDLNCIRDARLKKFDILLILGYTSSSIWGKFYPRKSVVITNMDGMEWQRTKYAKPVRRFLRYAEKLAVRYSKFHIADSVVIRDYLDKKYGINCRYIPYGATNNNGTVIKPEKSYYLLMARMEKENNIEMILDGFQTSSVPEEFIVIGDTSNKYGQYLVKKYSGDTRIKFKGGIFDRDMVDEIVAGCHLYFHGHSVGGTNPSLLEAMAANVLIAAHDNPYNRAILGNDGLYFSDVSGVCSIIKAPPDTGANMIKNNALKISTLYNWGKVVDDYEEFFKSCLSA